MAKQRKLPSSPEHASSESSLVTDVYLSHAADARKLTGAVKQAFESAGLTIFDSGLPARPGAGFPDEIRHAIAESAAFVAILTPSALTSQHLPLEYGAAWSWEKPVYPVVEDLREIQIPVYLKSYRAFPISRLDELVNAVRKHAQPLSDTESEQLASIYADIGIPADELLLDRSAAQELVRRFNRAAGLKRSAEHVLRELVRMRKRGKLPRLARPATRGAVQSR